MRHIPHPVLCRHWATCTQVLRMGMGAESTHPVVPGVITVGMSAQHQRGFYKP
jgi:hypothetical protein